MPLLWQQVQKRYGIDKQDSFLVKPTWEWNNGSESEITLRCSIDSNETAIPEVSKACPLGSGVVGGRYGMALCQFASELSGSTTKSVLGHCEHTNRKSEDEK